MLDVVRQAPEGSHQVGVQDADVQRRPGRGSLGGHRGGELLGVGVGDQVQLAHRSVDQQERRAGDRCQLAERQLEGVRRGRVQPAYLGSGGRLGRQGRDRHAGHHAVDGVHLRSEGRRVDQQAQAVVPRPDPGARLVPVGLSLQVGGVAVVAVGDQRLARKQVLGDGLVDGLVGDRPQPVP